MSNTIQQTQLASLPHPLSQFHLPTQYLILGSIIELASLGDVVVEVLLRNQNLIVDSNAVFQKQSLVLSFQRKDGEASITAASFAKQTVDPLHQKKKTPLTLLSIIFAHFDFKNISIKVNLANHPGLNFWSFQQENVLNSDKLVVLHVQQAQARQTAQASSCEKDLKLLMQC